MLISSKPTNFVIAFFLTACAALAGGAPVIVSRAEWKAKPPVLEMITQAPSRILIHHTASKKQPGSSLLKKMTNLQHFSQTKQKLADGRTKMPWADIPYHFYIAADGQIAEGRTITAVGDTNTGYDPAGYIQIVVEGNFEIETPSKTQLASLENLLRAMMERYDMKASAISFHQGVAQTACPGKNLIAALPGIMKTLGEGDKKPAADPVPTFERRLH